MILVSVDRGLVTLQTRNVISSTVQSVTIASVVPKLQSSRQDNQATLARLRASSASEEGRVPAKSEDRIPTISPEWVTSTLALGPGSRPHERQLSWERLDLNADLLFFAELLDRTPVHTLHTVAILYIPKGRKGKLQSSTCRRDEGSRNLLRSPSNLGEIRKLRGGSRERRPCYRLRSWVSPGRPAPKRV